MPEKSQRPAKLFTVLQKCAHALGRYAARHMESTGLCASDFMALEALLHKGPMTISALGARVLLTSGSMTAAIDRLEARRLVERRAVAEDRRARLVQLTPAGKRLITAAYREHERALAAAMEVLTPREQDQLCALAKKLGLSVTGQMAESDV